MRERKNWACTEDTFDRCPLWVRNGHSQNKHRCPLYPSKQTLLDGVARSALCQKRTHREKEPLFRAPAAEYAFSYETNPSVMNRTAVLYALISAALFGLSTPAAKLLVGSIHPVTLAGLLYCGAGIGVAILRRIVSSVVAGAPETAVSRAELPWLAAAIGAGGVLGPLMLMVGLARTDAATASLL